MVTKTNSELFQDTIDHYESQIEYAHSQIHFLQKRIEGIRQEIKKLIKEKRIYQRLLKEEKEKE